MSNDDFSKLELEKLKERADRYSSYMPIKVGYSEGYMQGVRDARTNAAEQFELGMKTANKAAVSEDIQIKRAIKSNEVMYAAMRACTNLMESAKLEAEEIMKGMHDER